MFRYTERAPEDYAPIIHIRVYNKWRPVNLADVQNKFGGYWRQPSSLGSSYDSLESANLAALQSMYKQYWPIRNSPLAKAHALSGNQIYFLNKTDPEVVACYHHGAFFRHDELKYVIKNRDCTFFSTYLRNAKQQYLDPIGNPGKVRNTFIHELGHWLDYTLSLYSSPINDEEARHSDLPLFRFLADSNTILSAYQDLYTRIYINRPTLPDAKAGISRKETEAFAEFSGHFYGAGDCRSNPILNLYFSKILDFQLEVMFNLQLAEQELTPLKHLGKIIKKDPDTLLETYLPRQEAVRVRIELMKANQRIASGDNPPLAELQPVMNEVAKSLATMMDNMITHVKQKTGLIEAPPRTYCEEISASELLILKRHMKTYIVK